MSVLATAAFWVATAERAARTAAQVAVGCVTANGTNLTDMDWQGALSIVGAATLLSVLMSVAASGAGAPGPGLTEELPTTPPEVAP